MTDFRLHNRIVGIAVFAFTVMIYFITVAPTVAFWDCGEFITTSYLLGVPHPPGARLYTLLGRIFSMLGFLGEEIALRVNFLSAASGAVTVLLLYLCSVRLLRAWLDPAKPGERLAILVGGAVSGLSVAFSTSFWGNASEAEVYGLSMLITILAFWFALKWDDAHKDGNSDRLLLAIAYLFGLGAGVHLQALLTVPGILILVFTDILDDAEDQSETRKVLIVAGLVLFPVVSVFLPFGFTILFGFLILFGLIALRPSLRNPVFWTWAVVLAGLGFSTYLTLYIRSGLNPTIDMNNPETWENFRAFLAREQYGAHFVLPRRGDFWAYQLNIHIKYFLQQFPFYDAFSATFRRAVTSGGEASEIQVFSILPLALGIGGAWYHLKRDWQRFASVLAMFLLMGIGLVLYLNMPDPEPREREYIFVGAYTFFGLWMGIGAAGLIASAARSARSLAVPVCTAVCLVGMPLGIMHNNWFSHDRTGDSVPYDYAYNILQTCEPNALLFTNGDNDTYPLWFLQQVIGVRTDVKIVNLSLIKTPWYIQQLRDIEPVIPLGLTDAQIEEVMLARPFREPHDVTIGDLVVRKEEIPTAMYRYGSGDQRIPVIEAHTLMIWWLISHVDWMGDRPVYFAVTVPTSNLAGLRGYLSMEGMAFRLVPEYQTGQFDIEKAYKNLVETYRYRGIADTTVYKDPVSRRLLGNYLVLFEGLVQALTQTGQLSAAYNTLLYAEQVIPPVSVDHRGMWTSMSYRFRDIASGYRDKGDLDSAVISLEQLLRVSPDFPSREAVEQIIETWRTRPDTLVVP